MKTLPLTSLIAIGALMPLTAWAQTTGIHTYAAVFDNKPGAGAREDHRPDDQELTQPRAASPDATRQLPRADADRPAAASSVSALGSGEIQRIPADELAQRVTASSLMGKKVVDREGQEIGKVKDVGLSAVAPQLAAPQASTGQTGGLRQQASSGSGSGLRGGESAATDFDTQRSPGLDSARSPVAVDGRDRREDGYLAEQRLRREVDRAGTPGSDPGMEAGSSGGAGAVSGTSTQSAISVGEQERLSRNVNTQTPATGAETRILVQPERSLGLGTELVAIPTSQIHREGDTLRLDISREELRTIVARQPSSSRVSLAE